MERKFDELGRISIPREFRKKLNLENGAVANIELEDNKIIVTNPSEVDYKERIYKAMHRIQLLQMDGEVSIRDLGLIINDLKGE